MQICAKNLLLVAIVTVLIHTGSCIKCYNCVSTMHKECLDPNEHPELKPQECSPELLKSLSNQVKQYAASFGAAIGMDIDKSHKQLDQINNLLVCQKIETMVNNEKVIIRGCQMDDESSNLDVCKTVQKRTEGTVTHCSLCKEDGCNAAHWLTPVSTLAILLPSVIVAFTTYFF